MRTQRACTREELASRVEALTVDPHCIMNSAQLPASRTSAGSLRLTGQLPRQQHPAIFRDRRRATLPRQPPVAPRTANRHSERGAPNRPDPRLRDRGDCGRHTRPRRRRRQLGRCPPHGSGPPSFGTLLQGCGDSPRRACCGSSYAPGRRR